jgi:IS5 family transposase
VWPPPGGEKTGANPTDRGKKGSKRHVVWDRIGIPLCVMLSAANIHDSMVFEELINAVEPIKRPGRGRPRKCPQKLHADKAYDDKKCKGALRRRGIKSRIARKGVESSEKLGRHRWVVEMSQPQCGRRCSFAEFVGSRAAPLLMYCPA